MDRLWSYIFLLDIILLYYIHISQFSAISYLWFIKSIVYFAQSHCFFWRLYFWTKNWWDGWHYYCRRDSAIDTLADILGYVITWVELILGSIELFPGTWALGNTKTDVTFKFHHQFLAQFFNLLVNPNSLLNFIWFSQHYIKIFKTIEEIIF